MKRHSHNRSIVVRRATAADQDAIVAIVRSEPLNPMNLAWPNFLVAVDTFGVAGAVQMRRHRDGSRELGSLVVAPRLRGRGVAARLIDELLAAERACVHMITDGAHAFHYLRWGFRRIDAGAAPAAIRRNYRIGRLMCLLPALRGRPVKRLALLERHPPVTPALPRR